MYVNNLTKSGAIEGEQLESKLEKYLEMKRSRCEKNVSC